MTAAENGDRDARMRWWREARFGMFVHWGLYSILARHEWAMNRESIPWEEYEPLADRWHPDPGAAREWARLAKDAGMKYMVLTTKHHEGFCLWDTDQTDFNSVDRGPGRDLVREFVDACREAGLGVGFYHSLMDWHHPDGARCAEDEDARRRFLDFVQASIRELCTNYGPIDIWWHDVPWPLQTPEAWESDRMNGMIRDLQPGILINDRSIQLEDFTTSEERIGPDVPGQPWESCLTFNGSWGYQPSPPEDYHSTRDVLKNLASVTLGGGNLLLNIGPKPDGSVPEKARTRLEAVGRWLDARGEAVYGDVPGDPTQMEPMNTGWWTVKGNAAYYWCSRWPGSRLTIGGMQSTVIAASFLSTGEPIEFRQEGDRLILEGLPESCPDDIAQVEVIKLECSGEPLHRLGPGGTRLRNYWQHSKPWRHRGG